MKRTLCRSIAILIYGVATFLLLLLVVVPLAVSLLIRIGYFPTNDAAQWFLLLLQRLQIISMHTVCWAWIFFLGGCFASFLNVVAYRIPRRQSILGSSHCPQCNIKLTFRNNLPIIGWLRNGGHCANCDLPIPVRYLVAEIILGSIFLLLFATQTLTGGATIPFRKLNQLTGIENILVAPQADLLIILGFHLTLLSLIFTFALIASEKFIAPISIVIFGALASLAFQLFVPSPGLVNYQLASFSSGSANFIHLTSDWQGFAIAVAIAVFVAALCFVSIKVAKLANLNGVFASLLLVGIFLGWQATLSVTIISLILFVIVNRQSGSAIVLVSTVIHLCHWRLQSDCSWWPAPGSDYPQIFAAICYIVALTTVVRFLNSRQKHADSHVENLPIVEQDLQ